MEWRDNDDLFLRECKTGHFWENYVGLFLQGQGLKVCVGEQSLRQTIDDAWKYKDVVDIVCEEKVIEVKSRALCFHTPKDLPYEHMMVDTKAGWDAKSPVPSYIVCVSQQTGAMVYLESTTQLAWSARSAFDNIRHIDDTFYFADKFLWQPIEKLVALLKDGRYRQDATPVSPTWTDGDGTTCINIYSQSKTELGRWMSNWACVPIETEDGHFESIEGYWGWIGSRDERCRMATGYGAKQLIQKVPDILLSEADFHRKIKLAIVAKVFACPRMLRELRSSTLPLQHYYVNDDRPRLGAHQWLVEFWEEIRKGLG